MFCQSPKPITDTWSKPTCSPLALFRGVPGYADGLQPGQTCARIESRHTEQPGIDHHADTLDRQARFGDRSCQNDLPCTSSRWCDRTVLRLLREISMERRNHDARAQVGIEELPLDPPDFRHSGEKNQEAAVVVHDGSSNGLCNGGIKRTR